MATTAPAPRQPITCHVLNTVTGHPASSLPVTLTLLRPYGPSNPLTAVTDADGRVSAWDSPAEGPSLTEIFGFAKTHAAEGPQQGGEAEEGGGAELVEVKTGERGEGGADGTMVWALRFDVGGYFGGEGFWDVVEVRFKTVVEGGRRHWHVPLLLSPWSYTTYRGS